MRELIVTMSDWTGVTISEGLRMTMSGKLLEIS